MPSWRRCRTKPRRISTRTDRGPRDAVGSGHNVAAPAAFYKIATEAADPDHPGVIAFLVRHMETEPDSDERLPEARLTSADEARRATGRDFLTRLPEPVHREIEAVTRDTPW